MSKNFIKTHKKELKLSNCGFDHDPVDSMVRSQWQSRSKNNFYLAYRWLVAAFVITVVVVSMYSHLQKYSFGLFFIYLTHWGILINMIVGVYGAILVTVWHFHTDFKGIHRHTIIIAMLDQNVNNNYFQFIYRKYSEK